MKNKGTISGMIIAMVSLVIYAVLLMAFYPIITTFTASLDNIFQLVINFALVAIGIGIVVEIVLEASRGSQVQYG